MGLFGGRTRHVFAEILVRDVLVRVLPDFLRLPQRQMTNASIVWCRHQFVPDRIVRLCVPLAISGQQDFLESDVLLEKSV